MKRTFIKWIGIVAMAGAITFSLIQVRIPVVKADGCPDNPFPECMCSLNYSTSSEYGETTHYYCVYDCVCGGGGGGDFFLIQRDYVN